jgi:hypothetical protein
MTTAKAPGSGTVASTSTAVVLRPITVSAAREILAGKLPTGLQVASDYPTEFSIGIAQNTGRPSPLGPYFVHRSADDLIVAGNRRWLRRPRDRRDRLRDRRLLPWSRLRHRLAIEGIGVVSVLVSDADKLLASSADVSATDN